MKKSSIIFIMFLLFTDAAISQTFVGQKPEKNVPLAVSTAFQQKFPSHEAVWFSNYRGRYNQTLVFEGRFIFDNRYSYAVYDKEGNMVAFLAQVEKREIPQKAMKYMNENYPSFPILDSVLVTSNSNGITYELGIILDGEYIIKVFSEEGNFVKSTRA